MCGQAHTHTLKCTQAPSGVCVCVCVCVCMCACVWVCVCSVAVQHWQSCLKAGRLQICSAFGWSSYLLSPPVKDWRNRAHRETHTRTRTHTHIHTHTSSCCKSLTPLPCCDGFRWNFPLWCGTAFGRIWNWWWSGCNSEGGTNNFPLKLNTQSVSIFFPPVVCCWAFFSNSICYWE